MLCRLLHDNTYIDDNAVVACCCNVTAAVLFVEEEVGVGDETESGSTGATLVNHSDGFRFK